MYNICVASLEHIQPAVEFALSAVDDPLERVRALIRADVRAILVHQDMHSTMLTELRALGTQRRGEIVRLRDGSSDSCVEFSPMLSKRGCCAPTCPRNTFA